jgi:dihydroorotase
MKLLIKQAHILDSNSEYHLQQKDILIENGFFTKITDHLNVEADIILDAQNLYLSCGFIDVFSNFNDPGLEQKETLKTGALAAQKGGYTTVFVIPNTNPCLDNKTTLEYISQQKNTLPISILPIGAVTKKTDGKELTEMIEMHNNGAIAFSDGLHCIQSSSLLLKALQYIKAFNGVVIQMPFDASLSANGYVNEGIVSTQLGLMGIPGLAEELIVSRDIELCAYANSKLHITGISTSKSLALIKEAKAKNINVTCSVSPYHLLLNENEIKDYNTNAKVNPPLRTNEDVLALQQGIIDGTIDCIATHHQPHELDAKQCEYALAEYGMSTIELTFNALASVPNITAEKINLLLHKNASAIFNLTPPKIAVGENAVLTLFTLDNEFLITKNTFLSKGQNCAFIGKKLNGKIVATINALHNYIA